MQSSMRLMNITPMFLEHKEEICRDLERMYREGIASEAAFMFKINPEGNPPVDKIALFRDSFLAMRGELQKHCDMPVGILLQSTIGHGWMQDTPPDGFERLEGWDHNDAFTRMACPLDGKFRAYIFKSVQDAAKLNPAFFMVDDDFRLFTGRQACFCQLHIRTFNERKHTRYDKESLKAAIEKSKELSLEYERFVSDSLTDLAKSVRKAIDSVDSSIPCSFCACTTDMKYAIETSKALAGPDAPSIVRINNGHYLSESMRDFPQLMYRTAHCVAMLDGISEVLAEPDTCPHNQYSTSAALMNCHMAGSILEGCTGAKQWVTRLGNWEPESGEAYRNILIKYHAFYQALFDLRKRMSYVGFAFPIPCEDNLSNACIYQWEHDVGGFRGFAAALARMGIPANFDRSGTLPVFLMDSEVGLFSDGELKQFFKNGMVINAKGALELARRGFGAEFTGVTAETFPEIKTSYELLGGQRIEAPGQDTMMKITPASGAAEVLTTLIHTESAASVDYTPVAPGTVRFKNRLGGMVVTLAGTPYSSIAFGEFPFLNQTRKRFLLELMDGIAEQAVLYPGTYELFLKTCCAGRDLYLPLINLGRDDLDGLVLAFAKMPEFAESLSPGGVWEKVAIFGSSARQVTLKLKIAATTPYLFRFKNYY